MKAVKLPGGDVTTDPAHIAKAPTDHWRKVFGKVDLSTNQPDGAMAKGCSPCITAHATATLISMGSHQSRHRLHGQAFREHNGGPRPPPV